MAETTTIQLDQVTDPNVLKVLWYDTDAEIARLQQVSQALRARISELEGASPPTQPTESAPVHNGRVTAKKQPARARARAKGA